MAQKPKDQGGSGQTAPDADYSDSIPPHIEASDLNAPVHALEEPSDIAQSAPEPQPAPDLTEPAIEGAAERSGGGILPSLLGGVAAAAIGFGAGYLLTRDAGFDSAPLEAKLTEQSEQIGALQSRIAALSEGPDLSALEQEISDSHQGAAESIAALSEETRAQAEELTALDERLTSVELRGQGGVADETTLSAYERELVELRDQMSAQSEELTAAAEDASSRLEALEADAAEVRDVSTRLREEAETARTAAEEARAMAEARTALSAVETALMQGRPYQDALLPLAEMVDVPEVLSAPAGAGVATEADLREQFSVAARDALAEARATGESGEEGGGKLGAFFRSQFQVRSTTARDGASADAILSRAEAALKSGDLNGALTEIDTLPEAAKAPLADWADAARTRADAVEAASGISTTLTEK